MRLSRARFSRLCAFAVFAIICAFPGLSAAQMHANSSVWIHRNDGYPTTLHARGDSLCRLEFPSRCWGGMMSPDSLFCRFWTIPPESLPPHCLFAYGCSIQEPDGHSMMSGHMMDGGFFRQQLRVTFHYDAAAVSAAGLETDDLVLVIQHNGIYEVLEAEPDKASSTLRLDVTRLSSWYGIMARSQVPTALGSAAWGEVKEKYR